MIRSKLGEGICTGRVLLHQDPHEIRHIHPIEHAQRVHALGGSYALTKRDERHFPRSVEGKSPHVKDDYRLRAATLSIPIIQAAGLVGRCRQNPLGFRPLVGLPMSWHQLHDPIAKSRPNEAHHLRRHGDCRCPAWLFGGQVRAYLHAMYEWSLNHRAPHDLRNMTTTTKSTEPHHQHPQSTRARRVLRGSLSITVDSTLIVGLQLLCTAVPTSHFPKPHSESTLSHSRASVR